MGCFTEPWEIARLANKSSSPMDLKPLAAKIHPGKELEKNQQWQLIGPQLWCQLSATTYLK